MATACTYWQSRAVSAPLTLEAALRLAETPRHVGGVALRYAKRAPGSATVLVWSAPPEASDAAALLGSFTLRWRTPAEGQAAISRLAWDLGAGATEQKLWRVLEELARVPLRPEAPGERAEHVPGGGRLRGEPVLSLRST
jgi:hypothetical protein